MLDDIFQNVLNSKINCISTSFKKEISFLSHVAKKLHARQISQNACPKKTPKKFCFENSFCYIFKTVLVVDLTFKC